MESIVKKIGVKKSALGTSRYWCFTWNNFTEGCLDHIDKSVCDFIIYGIEHSKEGTIHYQGYIEVPSPKRMDGMKKLLCKDKGIHGEIHLEKSKSNRAWNMQYCAKGAQTHDEWEEFGTTGPNYGVDAQVTVHEFKIKRQGQGKRNDWDEVYKFIQENPEYEKVLEAYPEYAIKYSTGIEKAIQSAINAKNTMELKERLSSLKLMKWQTRLINELKYIPDERRVIWYIDTVGGRGKTTFAKYLLAQGDCAYFTNAKTSDIAYAYKGERTVIFDFSRSVEGRPNYEALEAVKNGLIFSPKYNSTRKICRNPHVICLANWAPDTSKLSADRWDIRDISKEPTPSSEEDMPVLSKASTSCCPYCASTYSMTPEERGDRIEDILKFVANAKKDSVKTNGYVEADYNISSPEESSDPAHIATFMYNGMSFEARYDSSSHNSPQISSSGSWCEYFHGTTPSTTPYVSEEDVIGGTM